MPLVSVVVTRPDPVNRPTLIHVQSGPHGINMDMAGLFAPTIQEALRGAFLQTLLANGFTTLNVAELAVLNSTQIWLP